MTYVQPVAVDSIFVLDLFLDCLCEADTENGPYPTETFASVAEAETALSREEVAPEN